MAYKLRLDISNANFDNYFARAVENMTDGQREEIPKGLQMKLFRGGGQLNTKSSSKLTFLERVFILQKAFNKNVVILIEDEEMVDDEINEWRKEAKMGEPTEDATQRLLLSGRFALGTKELFETYAFLNRASASAAYNFISRVRNTPKNKVREFRRQSRHVIDFLANYESQKKKIVMERGLKLGELYTLFYLYDGEEKLASKIYTDKFRYAYNASRAQIHQGFVSLQARGFITKKGRTRGATMRITIAGMIEVDEIVSRYLIHF